MAEVAYERKREITKKGRNPGVLKLYNFYGTTDECLTSVGLWYPFHQVRISLHPSQLSTFAILEYDEKNVYRKHYDS